MTSVEFLLTLWFLVITLSLLIIFNHLAVIEEKLIRKDRRTQPPESDATAEKEK